MYAVISLLGKMNFPHKCIGLAQKELHNAGYN